MRVAGIGFRRGATIESLQEALAKAESLGGAVAMLATIEKKSSDPALLELAQSRGIFVRATEVSGVDTPTKSARITEMHGTGSVAEAAALAVAGPGARIKVRRISSADGMATAAIAEVSGEDQ